MKRFILLLTLVVSSIVINAQKPIITGLVVDADTREPLPGVSVVIDDTTGTITNENGKYEFTSSVGFHKLEFRYVGYTSNKTSVTLLDAQAQIINIALKNSANELGMVVVSAGKFEQNLNEVVVSMEIIKPKSIETRNTVSMDEAVDNFPGVNVIDGQANIRGGSGFSYGAGSRVLILVDDMPMLAADANDVKWSFLPIENLEQVEVIKGASSALFGSSAMNGVINFRTAYPKSVPATNVTFFSGFFDSPKDSQKKWWPDDQTQMTSGINFNHSEKFNQFDLVLGGQFFNDNGYKLGEIETRGRINVNTRYRFKKVDGLSVGVNINSQQATGGLFLIWQNDSTGALIPQGGSDTATTTISDYVTTRVNIDPFITYYNKKGDSHKLRYRYFLTDNKNNTNQESQAAANYAEYQYQKKFKQDVRLTTGLVYLFNNVSSELYGNHHSDNIAAYAQADAKAGKFNFSVGGRIERNTIDTVVGDVVPVFRTGVNYELFKGTNFRASIGQGYRFPSIAEKFVKTQVGDVVIYPNDSLQPEYGYSFEFGIQQGFKLDNFKGYIDVAVFRQRYQDMMEFTFGAYGGPGAPLFGLGFKSLNIGNAQITGIDITAMADGNIGLTRLTFMAGYTYINPINPDFTYEDTLNSTADYNILKYRYKTSVKGDVEVGWKKINVGMSVRYFSYMENIDKAFELFISGVKHWRETHEHGDWIFDSRIRYDFDKNISASFIVKNFTNHEWTGRPADMQPIRQYVFQVALKF